MLAIDRIWAEMSVFYRIDFAVLAHLVRSPDYVGTVITRSCGAGWVGDFNPHPRPFSFRTGRNRIAWVPPGCSTWHTRASPGSSGEIRGAGRPSLLKGSLWQERVRFLRSGRNDGPSIETLFSLMRLGVLNAGIFLSCIASLCWWNVFLARSGGGRGIAVDSAAA